MVRTMISSSSAFGSARARVARAQNQYGHIWVGVRFELRRLGTGPSALRAVHRFVWADSSAARDMA